MAQEPPPGQSDEEIQALAVMIAENLAEGESPEKIAQQLVDNGWEAADARGFVGAIQQRMQSAGSGAHHGGGGGEGMGWLIWIGAIVGINVLSAVFDWGFWIY